VKCFVRISGLDIAPASFLFSFERQLYFRILLTTRSVRRLLGENEQQKEALANGEHGPARMDSVMCAIYSVLNVSVIP
jgi:hypothetical protein